MFDKDASVQRLEGSVGGSHVDPGDAHRQCKGPVAGTWTTAEPAWQCGWGTVEEEDKGRGEAGQGAAGHTGMWAAVCTLAFTQL